MTRKHTLNTIKHRKSELVSIYRLLNEPKNNNNNKDKETINRI